MVKSFMRSEIFRLRQGEDCPYFAQNLVKRPGIIAKSLVTRILSLPVLFIFIESAWRF